MTICSFVVKIAGEFIVCVHTYRKFADELYEVYENNIYFFSTIKMDDDDDDIIITATCLFIPKISAILAHVSSFSSSVASR